MPTAWLALSRYLILMLTHSVAHAYVHILLVRICFVGPKFYTKAGTETIVSDWVSPIVSKAACMFILSHDHFPVIKLTNGPFSGEDTAGLPVSGS